MSGNFEHVVKGFEMILDGLGVPPSEHTKDTARRAAKAWYHELCAGLTKAEPDITTFVSESNNMVVLRAIPVRSLCAHHLLPFFGEAVVAYIPGAGKILGLSKLSRITDYWSRRLQVQEELTEQIATHVGRFVIAGNLGGVGVTIRANHMCMMMRGVQHSGDMVTTSLRGVFREDPTVRAEFLSLSGGKA